MSAQPPKLPHLHRVIDESVLTKAEGRVLRYLLGKNSDSINVGIERTAKRLTLSERTVRSAFRVFEMKDRPVKLDVAVLTMTAKEHSGCVPRNYAFNRTAILQLPRRTKRIPQMPTEPGKTAPLGEATEPGKISALSASRQIAPLFCPPVLPRIEFNTRSTKQGAGSREVDHSSELFSAKEVSEFLSHAERAEDEGNPYLRASRGY